MAHGVRTIVTAALAAALAFLAPGDAPAQQSVSLSLADARVIGREAWRRGDHAFANQIARGLLEANPEDTAALLLLSATETELGRPDAGRRAGARAWASTDSKGLRHEAAFLTYRAAAIEERYTTAQFWLRRAYQTAETEDRKENIGKSFRQLRAASPWVTRFSFDVSPSSNLNGGASSEFLVIDESYPVGLLSGAARALSGTRAALQVELGYNLSQSPDQRTAITFNGYRTFNRLSEEAKEIAPEAEGSDFDYGVAEIVFSHQRRETPFFLPDTVALAFGQTWYGLEELDKVTRLTIAKGFDLTPRDRLRFLVQGEHRVPDREFQQDRQGREARVDYYRQFRNGHLLTFRAAYKNVTSDDVNQSYDATSFRLGGIMGDDLGGFRLSGHVQHTVKDFDAYQIGFINVVEGREDQEISAGLNLHVDRVGYMGFMPVISLQGQWTESNISRFEAETLGLSVGFRSAF